LLEGPTASPPTWKVVAAFAAVYLVWGSTYLAIRISLETLPPFVMAGVRFLAAGTLLYAWSRRQGASSPSASQWKNAGLVGGLLFLCGNGAVVWAVQWVPSGLVALLVATAPLWMVLLHWLWEGGARPGPLLVLGLFWGLLGMVLLVGSDEIRAGPDQVLGALIVIAGSLCWGLGSIVQRGLDLPRTGHMSTAMQMLAGGGLMLLVGLLTGEAAALDPTAVSARSVASLVYLVIFGSMVAFSAYVWLLRVSTPARVGTYAYVNPVVALFLGWAFAGESLSGRTLLAAGLILTSVMLIAFQGGSERGGP
jgi:drug/metabolite transporter (DMT)-like permease